jgi:hypothetical protein
MRDLAREVISAMVLAAPDSADLETVDLALAVDLDAGVAASAALDGVSDLADSDLAGAASGIRSGLDRAGALDGVRRTQIITPTRIGLRMAIRVRPILVTTGPDTTTRLTTMATPLTAHTQAVGTGTATVTRRFPGGLRIRIQPPPTLRFPRLRFLFT